MSRIRQYIREKSKTVRIVKQATEPFLDDAIRLALKAAETKHKKRKK